MFDDDPNAFSEVFQPTLPIRIIPDEDLVTLLNKTKQTKQKKKLW